MAEGASAAERLERLLHIFPAATAEGGVPIGELARALDVDPQVVLDDLTEVTARSYYHPAGSGDDIQISIEAERVSVWTTGVFQRPVKLSPLEAFCLALGLRGSRMGGGGDGGGGGGDGGGGGGGDGGGDDGGRSGAWTELLRRVETHLATAPVPDEPLEGLHAADAEPDPEGIRELLVAGARDRTRCRIRYLKPGEPGPEDRVVHPYLVAHAQGRWYVVGWCESSAGERVFRLDRVLDAEPCGGSFETRDEVDVETFLQGGRVYRGDEETEVVVRYSPAVARWVEEWADEAGELDDGGLVVRHRVADPGWVVRHVLAYGGEAVVVEPVWVREMVGQAAPR